ncbi:hypothetical protein [Methylobacterium radiotolerans]|uniref:hypothetical protein n=1 Tax=Methylobacterium radiotolerans TaxID=31998 RepID=UPI001401E29E|nr:MULTISPECIES: hypothetical protein [Methylobacterium]MDE3747369.1 hypothetical protein [Methylobacterium radiotolerans]
MFRPRPEPLGHDAERPGKQDVSQGFLRGFVRDEATTGQHDDAVAEPSRERQIVQHCDDTGAVSRDGPKQRHRGEWVRRVEGSDRLVDEMR